MFPAWMSGKGKVFAGFVKSSRGGAANRKGFRCPWTLPSRGERTTLDDIDVRILREIVQGEVTFPMSPDIRKPYRAIAEKIGIDEDTACNRVRRLHRIGLIEGWRTVLNPRVFEGGEVAVWMDVNPPEFKDDVAAKVKLMQGVVILSRFHGSMLALILRYHDERQLQRQLTLIRMIAKTVGSLGRIPFPECRIQLSKLDWEILRAVYQEPRKPYTEAAHELGISSRTVKRRLGRLIEANALFAFPAINPKALAGSVLASLLVRYPAALTAEVNGKIARQLDPYVWHIFHMQPDTPGHPTPCVFNLALRNVATAHEILRWVREVPGILDARIDLFEEIHTSFEMFDTELEDRVGRLLLAAKASA